MGKWVIFFSVLIAGASLWFILLRPSMETSGDVPAAVSSDPRALTITHAFKDGVHRYDGAIRLPHSCYDVEGDVTHDPRDPSRLTLVLQTKDRMLEQNLCVKILTRYPFELVTDAPQEVTTTLLVDGVNMPINLIETEWVNPRGTILNLEN